MKVARRRRGKAPGADEPFCPSPLAARDVSRRRTPGRTRRPDAGILLWRFAPFAPVLTFPLWLLANSATTARPNSCHRHGHTQAHTESTGCPSCG
eukprot:2978795-Amphidinium_carterae.1